ncbi:unnamed protein product, partial [marine sediment metagenome]
MKSEKPVYGTVYRDVLKSDKLTMKGIVVYSMLTTYVNGEDKCWPSISTLTKNLPIDRSTVINGIKELIDAGIISKETGKNNRNIYTLSSGTGPPPKGQVVVQDHHSSGTGPPLSSGTGPPNHYHINNTINTNSEFENFWDQYHSITGMRKTDRKDAEKYWKKLNQEDQKKAVE